MQFPSAKFQPGIGSRSDGAHLEGKGGGEKSKSYPRNEGSEKLFCQYLLKRAFNATGLDSRPLCATLSTRFSGLSSISLSYSLAEHPLPFVAGSKIHQRALHSIFSILCSQPFIHPSHAWLSLRILQSCRKADGLKNGWAHRQFRWR